MRISNKLTNISNILDMINPFQWADIVAVEDDLPLEFVPIALDLVVLDHDYYKVDVVQECIKVVILVGNHIFFDERVVDL